MVYVDPSQYELLLHQAENQVKEAVALIPLASKRAYQAACEKCPDLVQSESHAIVFLRYCEYNVWAAAERLVRYWEDRFALFGERAFLPMTQTGDGALTNDDLVALHAGFFVFLPQTASGQDSLFVDRTKSLQSASREARLRCLFYMFQVLSESEKSQTKGILVFVLLVQPRVVGFDHEFAKRAVGLMEHSFAVKVHFHVLNCLPKSGKRDLVQSIIQNAVRFIMQSFQNNCEVYLEDTQNGLMSVMMNLGLPPYGIPAGVGGSWKYEEFTKWCRQRTSRERAKSDAVRFVVAPVSSPSPNVARSATADQTINAAGKNERKRLVNVIHSRQKRERRKAEHKLLEQEAQVLESKKRKLVEEHGRLKTLLSRAESIVSALDARARAPVPAVPAPEGSTGIRTVALDEDALARFNHTAALVAQKTVEERHRLLMLLLQNNPEFSQQLASHLSSQTFRQQQAEVHAGTPQQQQAQRLLSLIPPSVEQRQQQAIRTLLLSHAQAPQMLHRPAAPNQQAHPPRLDFTNLIQQLRQQQQPQPSGAAGLLPPRS